MFHGLTGGDIDEFALRRAVADETAARAVSSKHPRPRSPPTPSRTTSSPCPPVAARTGAEDELLAEQVAYYRANAPDYDRPYGTNDDLRRLLATADDLPISGDVLELACGTGQWTRLLAGRARSVTAIDIAAETLEIARGRATAANVEFVQADVFAWRPERRFDTVFFAFWLSHVPPSRLREFWGVVAGAPRPGGAAVFIDDGPAGVAHEREVLAGQAVPTVRRRTSDGGRYRVVKVFHDSRTLTADLAALGWTADIRTTDDGYLSGVARPPAGAPADRAACHLRSSRRTGPGV